ncbi:MAG: glycosyltransferase [Bacteroidia bacterium]
MDCPGKRSAGKARNNGIRNASGELIAFLDADDEWEPEKLAIQVKQLAEYQADLVFCDGWLIKTAEKEPLRTLMKAGAEKVVMGAFHGELAGKSGLRLLHRKNRIPTSAVLCTRKSIEKSGYFIEDLKFQNCEDYHLWVKMEERGFVLKGFENQLLLYRMHPGSSTSSALKSLKPLLNTLFIMANPLTEDLKVQVAGHMQSYISALTKEAKLENGHELFALYNRHVEEFVWRGLLNFTFRVSPGKLYHSLLWRHTARWVARDVDDDLRKQLRPD